jgi:hypothetical protein
LENIHVRDDNLLPSRFELLAPEALWNIEVVASVSV